jgi:hypothetical protein
MTPETQAGTSFVTGVKSVTGKKGLSPLVGQKAMLWNHYRALPVPPVQLLGEAIAPTLVQQTIDDQLALHLAEFATDFSSLGSVLSTLFELIFCELSMTKISSRDPCTPTLGFWPTTRPTMEPASPLLFICRALAWGPIAGFCSAPLTGPISTKAPFYANRNVVFNKHKSTPNTGYHYTTKHLCLPRCLNQLN